MKTPTKTPGYERIYVDDIPLLKCPSCEHTTDSLMLVDNQKNGFCLKCKNKQVKEEFPMVVENRMVFVCKKCKLDVAATPGNITWDGVHYMCPRCKTFLAPVSDFKYPNVN